MSSLIPVFLGWDPREADAWSVARRTILRHATPDTFLILKLLLSDLQDRGLYRRPTKLRIGSGPIDELSVREDYDGAMATEHAIARFFVPTLCHMMTYRGWALFMDCDILVRHDMQELFDSLDPRYAVCCVKHEYTPASTVKMDSQTQTRYFRKNWSSVMAFNCSHPANDKLTLEMLNTLPGRDLHRFCWLNDDQIGALDPRWNYLVGHTKHEDVPDPAIVHFTEGLPSMPFYEHSEYADEWFEMLRPRVSVEGHVECGTL